MGTRADFYVKHGKELQQDEWVGSIAFDGYPDGIRHKEYPSGKKLMKSKTEDEFKENLKNFFTEKGEEQVTLPKDGWPWPWDDSGLTDYTYVFDCLKGKVTYKGMPYPDMKTIQKVTLGSRSGLIVLSSK